MPDKRKRSAGLPIKSPSLDASSGSKSRKLNTGSSSKTQGATNKPASQLAVARSPQSTTPAQDAPHHPDKTANERRRLARKRRRQKAAEERRRSSTTTTTKLLAPPIKRWIQPNGSNNPSPGAILKNPATQQVAVKSKHGPTLAERTASKVSPHPISRSPGPPPASLKQQLASVIKSTRSLNNPSTSKQKLGQSKKVLPAASDSGSSSSEDDEPDDVIRSSSDIHCPVSSIAKLPNVPKSNSKRTPTHTKGATHVQRALSVPTHSTHNDAKITFAKFNSFLGADSDEGSSDETSDDSDSDSQSFDERKDEHHSESEGPDKGDDNTGPNEDSPSQSPEPEPEDGTKSPRTEDKVSSLDEDDSIVEEEPLQDMMTETAESAEETEEPLSDRSDDEGQPNASLTSSRMSLLTNTAISMPSNLLPSSFAWPDNIKTMSELNLPSSQKDEPEFFPTQQTSYSRLPGENWSFGHTFDVIDSIHDSVFNDTRPLVFGGVTDEVRIALLDDAPPTPISHSKRSPRIKGRPGVFLDIPHQGELLKDDDTLQSKPGSNKDRVDTVDINEPLSRPISPKAEPEPAPTQTSPTTTITVPPVRPKRKMTGMTSKHFSPEKKKPRRKTEPNTNDSPSKQESCPQTLKSEDPPTNPTNPTRRLRKRTTGSKSTYFVPYNEYADRVDTPTLQPRQKGISTASVPSIHAPKFGIIQERLWNEPFWLLIAVMLLNKTTGRAAVPIFWGLKERWPTPEDLASATQEEVCEHIRCLGLQNRRAEKMRRLAAQWVESPPRRGWRWRTLHYPEQGDGKGYKKGVWVEGDSVGCEGAVEVGYLVGTSRYAWDSWRIFCRDVLRGVAEGFNGEGVEDCSVSEDQAAGEDQTITEEHTGSEDQPTSKTSPFEPEWQRVLPQDKELRATLRWMWLREGWIWDSLTGNKRLATEEEMVRAEAGGMEFGDAEEEKFAVRAANSGDGNGGIGDATRGSDDAQEADAQLKAEMLKEVMPAVDEEGVVGLEDGQRV